MRLVVTGKRIVETWDNKSGVGLATATSILIFFLFSEKIRLDNSRADDSHEIQSSLKR